MSATPAERGRRSAPQRWLRRFCLAAFAGVVVLAVANVAPWPTGGSERSPAGRLPDAHVHAVAVDLADGATYLATHAGLYRYTDGRAVRVGPDIDLMGFAITGPQRFYASGHPRHGSALPDPAGLLQSTDGGRTWRPVSRQGVSDFHALATSAAGLTAFDGAFNSSTDGGATWTTVPAAFQPFALISVPQARVLLATTERGPVRSTDGALSWAPIPNAPLLLVLSAAADGTVVGAAPDGTIYVSSDAGLSWQRRGTVPNPPQALGAVLRNGQLEIVIATTRALLRSTDGGRTFTTGRGPTGTTWT